MTDHFNTHTDTDKPQGILDHFAQISGLDGDRLLEDLFFNWQQTLGGLKHSYASATSRIVDEVSLPVSQKIINDALNTYVVKNVGLLHDLHLDIHDGWLRLATTVNIQGIFASVASNFELVHLQLDRHTQRLVLRQISDTEVIELHTKAWWQAPLAKFALRAYHTIFRKDPLPMILSNIKIKGVPFTEHKGNVIYLEIGRWLGKVDMIMNNIKKVQINHGILEKEQLILKAEPNFSEILSFGDPNAPVITDKDNPAKTKTNK
ncbi:hypothetical protein LU290_06270 [Moraxella nasibovis]|uniref:hypothetical protein n=1 Tax=Moraxella nasibovis TaxID=2904120 RepID=UPI00240ED2A9|nr:hypothetical protein [Moraxella nasibovis]WFF37874.1 hypothetical protein LU290_06270 [Moraxella nasibovis]